MGIEQLGDGDDDFDYGGTDIGVLGCCDGCALRTAKLLHWLTPFKKDISFIASRYVRYIIHHH
jgi:hypothetical protein